jgi:hypothetical protein
LSASKAAHSSSRQITILTCGQVGEFSGFLNQGGFASLELTQLLTHLKNLLEMKDEKNHPEVAVTVRMA